MIVMVEQGCPWPTLPSGHRRSFLSLVTEARAIMLAQMGEEPSVIMLSPEIENEVLRGDFELRASLDYYSGSGRREKIGKYFRGIRLIVTSDVQLAVA